MSVVVVVAVVLATVVTARIPLLIAWPLLFLVLPIAADVEATLQPLRLRCPTATSLQHTGGVLAAVKTTGFYHDTRAAAVWNTWGSQFSEALIFASDAPLPRVEDGEWKAQQVVLADPKKAQPYLPPWRSTMKTETPPQLHLKSLPRLTLRIAHLLQALYDCWDSQSEAKWLLLVDDDTFLHLPSLTAFLEAEAGDPDSLSLLGVPIDSTPFTKPFHLELFGPSQHCGGNMLLLSRGLLRTFANDLVQSCLPSRGSRSGSGGSGSGSDLGSAAAACSIGGSGSGSRLTSPPRTTLWWYWDEAPARLPSPRVLFKATRRSSFLCRARVTRERS